eukprot:12169-Chlamydomonas_euryale.AAC.3
MGCAHFGCCMRRLSCSCHWARGSRLRACMVHGCMVHGAWCMVYGACMHGTSVHGCMLHGCMMHGCMVRGNMGVPTAAPVGAWCMDAFPPLQL